ncbi:MULTISPECIES: LysR family transcriptional regulator [Paraburkholderia]|uniref:LysR family transcriptional regulator n=1 Tax=Paraburkholderia TaxID=1822464 RepID=UPI0038BCC6BC
MTLKQLEAFYWAASLGSFSIAATRLHVTQSTLSKRIAELEAALNVPLFDRSAQRSVLTEHGTRILGHAHKILQFEGEIHELLGTAPRLSGLCRFGVSELTALTWFPKFVARVTTEHPDLALEPYVDLAAGLERRLVRGEIDFAILPQSSEDNPTLTSVPLAMLEFAWMSSPKRIPVGTVLKSEDIARHPILTMTAESRLTATYESWAAANKIQGRRILACNSLSAIVGLTVADVGISFLPRLFMRNLIEAGQLNAFRTMPELPSIEYCFKWRTDDTRAFISALAQFAKEEADYTLSLGSQTAYGSTKTRP